MTRPLHKLDPTLFKRAQALLDDEWLAHDADLGPILPTVLARNVGQDWHKAGTFRHNPWVGEPQMVLAQLYLSAGRPAGRRKRVTNVLRLGQRLGQARAMGRLGGVDAHPAAVGQRWQLARAA